MLQLGLREHRGLMMQIEEDDLARWARFTDKVRNQSLWLGRLISGGRLPDARRVTLELHLEAAQTLTAMELAGAKIPEYLPSIPDLPFELLTSPANQRLYRALMEASEAATEVDRERGRSIGWSDFISDKLARVEIEVNGPAGQGEKY